MNSEAFVLTVSCEDRVGIVHAVSGFLAERGCNIVDSQQFGDPRTGRFFMRVHFTRPEPHAGAVALQGGFASIGGAFGMDWAIHDLGRRTKVLVMVSKFGHCLNDLLYRWRTGSLPVDLVGVVSNHPDHQSLAAAYGLPFHYLPVTAATKAEQEARMLELVGRYQVDLVVLARYMQVLSDDLSQKLAGKVINIHHSFLPGFKGAMPHQQAHDRGVKLIGATAHYVTAELDEGPIIEQEVARVDHTLGPGQLAAVGREVECLALAHAVQAHIEHRILLDGAKTIVFR